MCVILPFTCVNYHFTARDANKRLKPFISNLHFYSADTAKIRANRHYDLLSIVDTASSRLSGKIIGKIL